MCKMCMNMYTFIYIYILNSCQPFRRGAKRERVRCLRTGQQLYLESTKLALGRLTKAGLNPDQVRRLGSVARSKPHCSEKTEQSSKTPIPGERGKKVGVVSQHRNLGK